MDQVITIALRGILLIAILWFFHGQYRQYRLDQFRQSLFGIRDRLFEDAESGMFVRPGDDSQRPFDAPAYTTIRTTLNGMIRFAHTLSFTRIVVMVVIHKYFLKDSARLSAEYQKEINRSRHGLSEKAKQRIADAEREMMFRTVTYILHSTFVLWVLVSPFAIALRLVNQLSKTTDYVLQQTGVRRWSVYRLLTAEANEIGRPTAAA